MALSRLLLSDTTGKMDFSKLIKNPSSSRKDRVDLKNPRSWEKTQGVVTPMADDRLTRAQIDCPSGSRGIPHRQHSSGDATH